MLGKVEYEQGAHAVVGEALPHLGEEQHVEAFGVARELRFLLNRHFRANCEEHRKHEDRDRRDPVALVPQGHVLHALPFTLS